MDKQKLKEKIKERIDSTYKEYKRQVQLYANDKMYARPDDGWFNTRIKTFNECLELIGMLD